MVCCWLSLPPLCFPSTDLRSALSPRGSAPPLFIAPPLALQERRRDRTLPILSLAAIKQLREEPAEDALLKLSAQPSSPQPLRLEQLQLPPGTSAARATFLLICLKRFPLQRCEKSKKESLVISQQCAASASAPLSRATGPVPGIAPLVCGSAGRASK